MYGSDEVADNDITLHVSMGVTNETGYPLASQTSGFVPFSGTVEGNLCLGGTIARFTSLAASGGATGVVDFTIDLTNMATTPSSSVMSGETWYFQVWHRDGSNSNYTNSVSVEFN